MVLFFASTVRTLSVGNSVNPDWPRLAGQSYGYLVETMRRYAEGERKNNADMTKIMQAISPADREAIARYIAGP